MEIKDIKINLKACRANASMSQRAWAESIGVSQGTITNWEKGFGEPTLTQLRKISSLSGIPMDCIFVATKALSEQTN